MADNISITEGSGTVVAADELTDATLGNVKVQFVKIMDGTLDGTSKAAVSASGLKVDLGADNDVTVTGTVTANLSATDNTVLDNIDTSTSASATSLAVIDDWDETDRCKVNLIAGQAGITAGAGTVGASTPRVTLASNDPGVALLTTIDADTSSLAGTVANSAVAVSTLLKITNVTLSLDTSAYASGDVLADSQIISACLRANDGTGTITNVTLTDIDDQGQGLDLLFLDANVSLGTENAAPSITDGNAANILGWVRINASDWIDLGGVRLASVPCTIPVKGVSGADDLYIAAISRGTGTYTASGIVVRVAIACD